MKINKIISNLQDLINKSPDYSLIDGLTILDEWYKSLDKILKEKLLFELNEQFGFDNAKREIIKPDNVVLLNTINYFIQDKAFNENTALDWLQTIKQNLENHFSTIEAKGNIIKRTKRLPLDEQLTKFEKEKNNWTDRFEHLTQIPYFDPNEESNSIMDMVSWIRVSKKHSFLFELPTHPTIKHDYTLLPFQQFRNTVFPSYQSLYLIEWINLEITRLKNEKEKERIKAIPIAQTSNQIPKLTLTQIALIYVYEGKQITRENGKDIAKQYEHKSGEKLFQLFCKYSSAANRKGRPTPCTPTKLKNKIELLESVVPYIINDSLLRANDEIQTLKVIFESEYQ